MSNFDDLESDFLEAQGDIMENEGGPVTSDEERRHRRDILKNRSGEKLKKEWMDKDRSELDKQIKAPPIISEPKCHVCQNDHRDWIERQLVTGKSYMSIAKSLPLEEGGVDSMRRSISNHWRSHMNLEGAAVRAIMEEEAQLLGQNVDEGVKGAYNHRAALEILARKGFEDAINNVTTVEPKDLIQLIKLHGELSTESGSTAVEEAKVAIRIFMLAIQNVMLKSDLIDREKGQELMVAINDEVVALREEESIDLEMEKNLMIPKRVS